MRRQQHPRQGPQLVVGGQRLLLEDVETRTGDLARLDCCSEIVEPRRQAAPDVDEEGGLLHLLKPRAVHKPLGLQGVRHGQDHEIGGGQQRVELVAAVQLGNPGRCVAPALVDADHPHPERGGEPRDLATDPADAHNECRRLGEMHDTGILRQPLPFAPELLRDVVMQPAGKGEHKGHDMRADVVVVDLAEIGDRHRVRDQLGIVIAGGGCRLRRLQPAQPRRSRQ